MLRAETWLTVDRTIAIKRAGVGRRTQVHMTMKKWFWIVLPSTSCLGGPIIVLNIVMKISIELITLPNDNATEKLYRFLWIQNMLFGRNFENLEKMKEWQVNRGMRFCSTRYPSGNQVDGSPLVAIGACDREKVALDNVRACGLQ